MTLDYSLIGKRIARRRKQLGLKQSEVEERAGIGDKYLSNIERAISIPSTEVIMRLAIALETTPDEFLVGAVRHPEEGWQDVAELLRPMNEKQLALARSLLTWLGEQDLPGPYPIKKRARWARFFGVYGHSCPVLLAAIPAALPAATTVKRATSWATMRETVVLTAAAPRTAWFWSRM